MKAGGWELRIEDCIIGSGAGDRINLIAEYDSVPCINRFGSLRFCDKILFHQRCHLKSASDSIKTHEFVLTIMLNVLSSKATLQLAYILKKTVIKLLEPIKLLKKGTVCASLSPPTTS